MKQLSRMLGVTLLEVMLVLAIAAMVILMSVKFYKSAADSNQVNTYMQTVQAITAAADGLAANTGSYAAATTAAVTTIVGANNMRAPWGAALTLTAVGTTGVTITPATAAGTSVCAQVELKLEANPKYAVT